MNPSEFTARLPDLVPADVNIVLAGLIRQRDHINDLIARIEREANASLQERFEAAQRGAEQMQEAVKPAEPQSGNQPLVKTRRK